MTDRRLEWRWGEKSTLAKKSEISPQYLSDILAGRKNAPPALAHRIADAAHEMGLYISRMDVLYPKESSNPLIKTHVVISNKKR